MIALLLSFLVAFFSAVLLLGCYGRDKVKAKMCDKNLDCQPTKSKNQMESANVMSAEKPRSEPLVVSPQRTDNDNNNLPEASESTEKKSTESTSEEYKSANESGPNEVAKPMPVDSAEAQHSTEDWQYFWDSAELIIYDVVCESRRAFLSAILYLCDEFVGGSKKDVITFCQQ